jgi:hypothetical protein
LIGPGSDVLGYDDEVSRDHEWGPRVLLFGEDLADAGAIDEALANELPLSVAGFPTHFGPTDEEGTARITAIDASPVAHRVRVLRLRDFLHERIGADPRDGFGVGNWLATPSQRLLELTSGAVFADPRAELVEVRGQLAWYPHDVWLYAMAGHWDRIAQYEHFVGRTGSRGDEVGSRWLAASLARDVMRLGFLQCRRYAPYAKWLGTAYASLDLAEAPALRRALAAADWRAREDGLVEACEAVARRHNELRVTDPVEPTARAFWGRPFRVLFADRFADALLARVEDVDVRAIGHPVGAIDAISDNTALLERPGLWRQVAGLYDRA